MSLSRRIPALLAALAAMAGGSPALAAAADADAETAERTGRSALTAPPADHAAAQRRHAAALADALGITDDRLATVLRELRAERRGSDIPGARPAVRSPAELARERGAYAAALAAKVGVAPGVAAAALDGVAPRPGTGTGAG
jgi:hypothetical protein